MDDEQNGRWVSTELGPVWKPNAGKPKRTTPHTLLKQRCRAALGVFRQSHNLAVVLLPSYVGKATTATGRDVTLGRKGQADDTALIRFGSGYGVSVAIEYKAGADRQSDHQRRFQERWEAAGGVYVLARKPQDLTDVLTRLLAEHGRGPF